MTHNSATFGPGKVFNAFEMGFEKFVLIANHNSLNFGTTDFSMDAWVKTSDNLNTLPIVDKRYPGSPPVGYYFFIDKGNLGVSLSDGVNSLSYIATTINIADNNWHYVAVTIDRVNKTGIMYVDAAQVPFDISAVSGSITNSSPLRLGWDLITQPPEYFNGMIDEVEMFNRVLLPEEIGNIFIADSSGKCRVTLGGRKYNDINENCIKDPDESYITSWKIMLSDGTTTLMDSTKAEHYGKFLFENLHPGNYWVWEPEADTQRYNYCWKRICPKDPIFYNFTVPSTFPISLIDTSLNFANHIDYTIILNWGDSRCVAINPTWGLNAHIYIPPCYVDPDHPKYDPDWKGSIEANEIYPHKFGDVILFDNENKNYYPAEYVKVGQGFWVYHLAPDTIIVKGVIPGIVTVQAAKAGWVLVGSRERPVDVATLQLSDGASIQGDVYRYDPVVKAYQPTTTINPCEGVWVYVTKACTITIP